MGDAATDHARMRKLLAPAFSARRMNRLRAHIDDLVDGLLDDLAAHGAPADLHEALSFPLPVLVICELLGVPDQQGATRATSRERRTGPGHLRRDDRGPRVAAAARRSGGVRGTLQPHDHPPVGPWRTWSCRPWRPGISSRTVAGQVSAVLDAVAIELA
jgi:cytochrome P450